MTVIGGNQRYAKLLGEFYQSLVYLLLFLDAAVLHFKIKPVVKDFLQDLGLPAGCVHIAVQDQVGDAAVQAGSQGNKAFIVGNQGFLVDPRLVVKTFQLGNAGKFHQVLVAVFVHG